MGRYAQARRRGNGAIQTASVLPTPTLEVGGPGFIDWSVVGADPLWCLVSTGPSGGPWDVFDTFPWSDLAAFIASTDPTAVCIGLDAAFAAVTMQSNEVTLAG